MNSIDIYKHLAWKVKFDTGDMPYPPIMFWKNNITSNDILQSWERTIKRMQLKKQNHNMGLYVHIPFCYTHCFFCTCVTKTEHRETEYDKYLDLIEKECMILSSTFKGVKFNTVYIGGGTPTILNSGQLERFYMILYKYFDLSEVFQIMTEGSPYTTTREKLEILKKYGVNKMTFGVQSLDAKTLQTNNRAQQIYHVQDAVKNAKDIGIQYINLDIMAGLPDQDLAGFLGTLKIINEDIQPDTVHINAFWPTKNTIYHKQGRKYSREDIKLRNEMRKQGHYLEEEKHKKQNSLLTHNVQLYNAKKFNSSILGLGYGSISHAFGELHYTKDSFDDYKDWLNGGIIHFKGYKLGIEEEAIAYVLNNCRNGVYLDKFFQLFGEPIESFGVYKKIEILRNSGIITFDTDTSGKYFKISKNSDVYCSVYSKHLYDSKFIQEFLEYMKNHTGEFSDLELRLNQFFTD